MTFKKKKTFKHLKKNIITITILNTHWITRW